MADDDTKKDPSETDDKKPETGKDEPKTDDLVAIKAALKKANKEAEDLRKKFKEIEDKDKSESERAADRAATAEKRAEEAELRAMRLEVAVEKGLTPKQAKRLAGATREELEADADEFLESIKPDESGKPPSGKPKEDLRGGGEPSEDPEEMDPRKLADMVPRY